MYSYFFNSVSVALVPAYVEENQEIRVRSDTFLYFCFVSWLISFSWRGDRYRSHGHHRLCGTLRKNQTYRSAPDLSMLLYCRPSSPSSSFRLNSYFVYLFIFLSSGARLCDLDFTDTQPYAATVASARRRSIASSSSRCAA
ncbi:unnamed protein product [Ixodes pacificus]